MSRVMSPRSIASSRSMRSSWCRAGCRSTRASASMHHVFRELRIILRCSSNAAACERDKEEVGVCGGGSREIMSDVMALRGFPPASIEQRDSRGHAFLGRFQGVYERLDGRWRVLACQGFDALGPPGWVAGLAGLEGCVGPSQALNSPCYVGPVGVIHASMTLDQANLSVGSRCHDHSRLSRVLPG